MQTCNSSRVSGWTALERRNDSLRRIRFSDETEDKLDALDKEFYRYPHNLTELLFAYVAKHPEEFGELPKPDDA